MMIIEMNDDLRALPGGEAERRSCLLSVPFLFPPPGYVSYEGKSSHLRETVSFRFVSCLFEEGREGVHAPMH